MPVTQAAIIARIREHLTESAARFWNDSNSYGLIYWYDEGAAKQHRLAFSAAEKSDLLRSPVHEYLRYFVKSGTGNLSAGTQDYSLPADFWRYAARLEIGTAPDIRVAEPAGLDDDWRIRNLPHFGPTHDQPRFSIIQSAAATAKLRVYVYGNETVPNSTDAYTFWYYRDVTATTTANVDLPDPFNEGPVAYAVGQALLKAKIDPTMFFTKFNDAAAAIIRPSQTEPLPQVDRKGL